MTKHNTIEKQINRLLTNAKQNLQGYREKTQLAFELFVAHYDTDLNKNSKPLHNIVNSLAQKDKIPFIDYVKQATNITGFKFSKDGVKLAFNGDSLTYDKDAKQEKQAFIYNDESFIKTIKALINKLKKDNCQVKDNLQKVRVLEKLITE